MKYPVFSIRDNLVGFLRPVVEVNQSVAIRNFRDGFSQMPDNTKDDYSLFYIGDFDDQTGEITSCTPKLVCHGSQFIDGGDVNEI